MIGDLERAEIRRLYFAEHWRVGTIAAERGLHHETVRRAIGTDRFVSRTQVAPSALDPFVDFLRDQLAKHPRLRATRLLQMIKSRGYRGSAGQLRRRIRQLGLRPTRAEAFLRLQTAPGEQAQVDWAHIGKLDVGGHLRPVYAFVMVMSWSRAIFTDFSFDMSAAAVVRGHARAFQFFGGAPRHCLYDNMKTVVVERVGDVVRYHDRIIELMAHYHFAPRVCRPRRANEKGRVERAIRYLRESFLAARSFVDLADLRVQFEAWNATEAMARKRSSDAEQTVAEALAHERTLLLALPEGPLSGNDIRAVAAQKQPYVAFDRNLYSIPHGLVGKPMTLVASDARVEVFDGDTLVAHHDRSWKSKQVIEDPEHIDALWKAKKAARHASGRERLMQQLSHAAKLYEALLACGEPMAPQTRALTLLVERFGTAAVDNAIADALARRTPRVHSIEQILVGKAREKRLPEPHPLRLPNRPEVADLSVNNHALEDYDDLAH